MKFSSTWILALTVFLIGGSKTALAEDSATADLDGIEQTLEPLEGKADASWPPPVAAAAAETSETGEAPSPFERAEEKFGLRYGRRSNVTNRGSYTDRQGPAARPGDFVLDPEYRGFILIPETVFMVKFNIKPRVDLIASSAASGAEFRFVPSQFPVPGDSDYGGGWRFQANGNGSQLRIDFRAPSVAGNFRLYYQNDFFGDDQRHMRYRLQHLYGQFHGVLGGFSFGLFEDPDAWPDTVDYEAPNAVIFARRALIHYKMSLSDDWQLTLGLENPDIYVDTTGATDASSRTRAPDGGFNIRWTPRDLGHVQFSSIFRSIGIHGDTVRDDDVFGWGVNLSGSLNIIAIDTFQFWFVYGEGVGGMGNDTSFLDSDAALNGAGRLEALEYWSAMGAFTHHWTPRWRSTATYGYVNLENTSQQDDDAYHLSHYGSVNLMYQVFKRLSVGLEGLYGYKKVKDGRSTDIYRIQLGIAYSIFD